RPLKFAVIGTESSGMPVGLNTQLPPSWSGKMKVPQGTELGSTPSISWLGHRQPSESEMLRSVSTNACFAVSRMPRTLPLKLPPLLKSTCRLAFCAVEPVFSICENDSTSPGHFSYTWVV